MVCQAAELVADCTESPLRADPVDEAMDFLELCASLRLRKIAVKDGVAGQAGTGPTPSNKPSSHSYPWPRSA